MAESVLFIVISLLCIVLSVGPAFSLDDGLNRQWTYAFSRGRTAALAGKYDEAEFWLTSAAQIAEFRKDMKGLLLVTLRSLTSCFIYRQDCEMAVVAARVTPGVSEDLFGTDDNRVAEDLVALRDVLKSLNENDVSDEMAKRVVKISERKLRG